MSTSHSCKGREAIFLTGFVTDGGTGGFEWRVDRGEVEALRAKWIEEGDADVSTVREVARPEGDGEAITKALDEQPELWEPRKGEGRSDTERLIVALDKADHHDLAAEVGRGVDLARVESQLCERGRDGSWAAHCVRRAAGGIGSPVPEALACPRCGGPLEASAKVYFDVTATERTPESPLAVTGLEFSDLNDSYNGHPAAMEHEVQVSCAECGHTPDFFVSGGAEERTSFYGVSPQGEVNTGEVCGYVVLDDGETFSPIAGAKVYTVPCSWGTERLEAALAEGGLTGRPVR